MNTVGVSSSLPGCYELGIVSQGKLNLEAVLKMSICSHKSGGNADKRHQFEVCGSIKRSIFEFRNSL